MIDTAEFRRQGLYDPDSPNADDRLALLRWLEDHGVSLEEMVDASKRSRLPALLADRVVRPGDRIDRAELAARAGIPLQRVEKIRRAVGFAAPESDVVVFTDGDVKTLRCRCSELSPRNGLYYRRGQKVICSARSRFAEELAGCLDEIVSPIRRDPKCASVGHRRT